MSTRRNAGTHPHYSHSRDPNPVKGAWQPDEDARVIELVSKLGAKKWSTIAAHLPGRIGKQCRERWHNHLNPAISKEPLSPEEDEIILQEQERLGNQWARISKHEKLQGRSDNAIKNRFYISLHTGHRKKGNSLTLRPSKVRRYDGLDQIHSSPIDSLQHISPESTT